MTTTMTKPDLNGRTARCGCGQERPSSTDLAFFEYLGPETEHAQHRCKHCGYYDFVHGTKIEPKHYVNRCPGFEALGDDGHDQYYCGCGGWD